MAANDPEVIATVFGLLGEALQKVSDSIRALPEFTNLEQGVLTEDALAVCEAAPMMCITAQSHQLATKEEMMPFHALPLALFLAYGNQWGRTGRNRELGVVRFYNNLLQN